MCFEVALPCGNSENNIACGLSLKSDMSFLEWSVILECKLARLDYTQPSVRLAMTIGRCLPKLLLHLISFTATLFLPKSTGVDTLVFSLEDMS